MAHCKDITLADLPPELPVIVALATQRCCMPLYWHDRTLPWPKKVTGGSCFVLKFPERLVLVTAAHVFRAYEEAVRHTPTTVCQVRLLPLDLSSRLIQVDHDLDIVTFDITAREMGTIGATAIDAALQPPPLQGGRGPSFAGFPELLREVYSDGSAEFKLYGGLPAVDEFSPSTIRVSYDPARDLPLMPGVPAPDPGFAMSGCSGGPVLLPDYTGGELHLFAVGLIVGGRRNIPGETDHTDIVEIRRINAIQPDGSIRRVREDGTLDLPSIGWLPPRR
jgi:hypothetical protein